MTLISLFVCSQYFKVVIKLFKLISKLKTSPKGVLPDKTFNPIFASFKINPVYEL